MLPVDTTVPRPSGATGGVSFKVCMMIFDNGEDDLSNGQVIFNTVQVDLVIDKGGPSGTRIQMTTIS